MIRGAINLPLVLHPSSDAPDSQVSQTIEIGVDRVEVWTDVRIPYLRVMHAALAGSSEAVNLLQATMTAQAAARQVVQHKLRIFNSVGKAKFYQ